MTWKYFLKCVYFLLDHKKSNDSKSDWDQKAWSDIPSFTLCFPHVQSVKPESINIGCLSSSGCKLLLKLFGFIDLLGCV